LPGPPREMKPMFAEQIAPVLKQRVGEVYILRRCLSIFGLTESKTDELAAPIYTQYTNPTTTILFKDGQIELHLTAQAKTAAEAQFLLDELAAKLLAVLGEYAYSQRDDTLETVVGDLLRAHGATL